ncbi:putative conserved secreted protein [Synechococcus sp. BOUM118]|nr:putative conserved secreted protein [Synechococcus sp. BOUM118]QNJ13854.1 putative conserved secreted protein [Synechococcus sp. A18-46.1]
MPQDTRIALFLLAQLVAALQANDPDLFKRWLYCAMQDPR